MVIVVASQKGGVGKTTTAVSVAGELVRRGKRVVLVDADPQGSASRWHGRGDGKGWPTIVECAKPVLHRPNQVPALMEAYDHVVIDTPPNGGPITRSALMHADLVVIPIGPSALDLEAVRQTLPLVEDAQIPNPRLGVGLLISRQKPRTIQGREIRGALEEEPFGEFTTFTTEVTERIAVTELGNAGDLIYLYDEKSPYCAEMESLCDEIHAYDIDAMRTQLEADDGF